MSDLYTDEMAESARRALIEHCVDSANQPDPEGMIRKFAESLYDERDPTVLLVLDVVAPLIAAKALRQAADWIDAASEDQGGLYAGDCSDMLHDRADEIERR